MALKISMLTNSVSSFLRNHHKFSPASGRKGNGNLHFPMKLKTSLL